MRSLISLMLLPALLSACAPMRAETVAPEAAAFAAPATPAELEGRYYAFNMNTIRWMGDVELSGGKLTTTRGSIPLYLQPGADSLTWIARLDEQARKVRPDRRAFCPGKRGQDQVRWAFVTLEASAKPDIPPALTIATFASEAPPTDLDSPQGCSRWYFERNSPGMKLTPAIRNAKISDH